MEIDFPEVEAKAKALPERERAHLAAVLIDSLDDRYDADAEEAWQAEIERRCREIDDGSVKLVPGDEVFAEARRLLK